jgi:transcriptional regulator with XRE-family HTH domain
MSKISKGDDLMALPTYQPDVLIDFVREKMGLASDAELCRALGIHPPAISKIRHRKMGLGATLLLIFHDVTGMSISELRALMGDNRKPYREIHESVTIENRAHQNIAEYQNDSTTHSSLPDLSPL